MHLGGCPGHRKHGKHPQRQVSGYAAEPTRGTNEASTASWDPRYRTFLIHVKAHRELSSFRLTESTVGFAVLLLTWSQSHLVPYDPGSPFNTICSFISSAAQRLIANTRLAIRTSVQVLRSSLGHWFEAGARWQCQRAVSSIRLEQAQDRPHPRLAVHKFPVLFQTDVGRSAPGDQCHPCGPPGRALLCRNILCNGQEVQIMFSLSAPRPTA